MKSSVYFLIKLSLNLQDLISPSFFLVIQLYCMHDHSTHWFSSFFSGVERSSIWSEVEGSGTLSSFRLTSLFNGAFLFLFTYQNEM